VFRVKLESGKVFEVPDEVEEKGLAAVEAFMVSEGYPTKAEREKAAKERAAKAAEPKAADDAAPKTEAKAPVTSKKE
jgi:hypothetical protein